MALTKLTTDLIDGTIVTSVNGSTGAVTLETGTDWQATPKTANFTAVAGEGYFVNTTSAAITVTLPSSPSAGDEVSIIDYGANAATNNITITSSDNIEGASDDLVLSTDKVSKTLVYSDATKGWLVTTEAGAGAAVGAFDVDYLIVAGGGGGGYGFYGGGGGAGGLRTSYANTSSLNGHNETALSLGVSTDYNLTVGAAGVAGPNDTTKGGNGSNSIFSTITSTGGGGGASRNDSGASGGIQNGNDGGSGGGAAFPNSSLGGHAVISPVTQGYDGADANSAEKYGTGGGGAGSTSPNWEDGGAGLAVNIISTTNTGTASVGEVSGSNVYFAGGGGGGGSDSQSYDTGEGGLGGGGNGSDRNNGGGSNGTSNTGGGGGGAGPDNTVGFAGGSGVIILRYPSARTILVGSGITEASGSPFTEGSDKVSVFTAGIGTISFS